MPPLLPALPEFGKSSWPPRGGATDTSLPLNPNIQKNPIPFGPYDYSIGPRRVIAAKPDPSISVNLNLFKNPIPFGPYDYARTPRMTPADASRSMQGSFPPLLIPQVTMVLLGQAWM